jgi:hypothetical protein
MSSYWKEQISKTGTYYELINTISGLTTNICICPKNNCIASNHYCLCKKKLICNATNHKCIGCNNRRIYQQCKSKHLNYYACSCPDPDILCEYDSDEECISQPGHICICETQGPEICLSSVHSCSCNTVGFLQCLYIRPSEWPDPLPKGHKQTIKNIIYQVLYCAGNGIITEMGILNIIVEYADNPYGNYVMGNIYYDTNEIKKSTEIKQYLNNVGNDIKFDTSTNIKFLHNEINKPNQK